MVSRFGGQGRETEDVALAKCIEDPVVCWERTGKNGGGGGVFSKLRVQIPVRCGPGFLARTVDSLRRWESKAEYHVNSGSLFP